MNAFQLLLSIAQSIAQALAVNKANPKKVAEFTGYLNLATSLATAWSEGNNDLNVLDEQLKEAVAERRGLTSDQRAGWRARDDLATEVARVWLAEHPKGG